MSGKIGKFDLRKLNRELQRTSVRIPSAISSLRADAARKRSEMQAQSRRKRQTIRMTESAFGKQREYQQAFEAGRLQFFPIRAQGQDVQSTKAGIQRHYGKKAPLGPKEGKGVAKSMAFHELKALGKIAAGVPFNMLKEYQSQLTRRYLGLRNVSERIPKRKRNFLQFVKQLNKLYSVEDDVWTLSDSIVNAVPDTAYFIPMKTETIVPTRERTMAPLAFAYDPSMQGFRVVYTITGDPMFSFLYFTAEDALKGREVHKKMLDWSLSPSQINDQYIALYNNPALYGAVYDLMYENLWGVKPPFERFAPGIVRPELITPDWVDQRLARNTLLTSIGDLGGLVENDSYPQEIRKKIIETQNRLRPYLTAFLSSYEPEKHNLPYHQRSDYTNRTGQWVFIEKASPELLDSLQKAKLLLQQEGI